jgi:tetratricopeptide (TPR) repeat protein
VQVSRTELYVKEIVVKGNEYVSRSDYSIALGYYDQATGIDPNYAAAWNNKGLAHDNLEEYFEAIECYDRAIKIDPNYAAAWFGKAVVLKNYLGKEKETARFFSKAEELGIKP